MLIILSGTESNRGTKCIPRLARFNPRLALIGFLGTRAWSSSLARRVVSLDKELHSTLPRFTQVYKRVSAKYYREVTLRWASIPSVGRVAMLLSMLHAKETFSRVERPSPLYLTY